MRRGYLLDASALLAVLFKDPGAERVLRLIDNSEIHAINLAEVVRKMMKVGVPETDIRTLLEELDLPVNDKFNADHAFAVAQLAHNNRAYGLSLGDCVCLSIARWMGQAAVTGDRRWSEIPDLNMKVVQIR